MTDNPFLSGIILNLVFAACEIGFGLAANSLALISDAGHNASDVAGLLIAWLASRLGKTQPTKRRTYGLRRSSILAALANAIVLLLGVGGIAWEALHRFRAPEPVASGIVVAVAAIGVVINALTALFFLRGSHRDLNVKGAFVHMTADAAVSLGVVVAGLGILATNWYWLDPSISLVIAVVIVWSTWGLLRESLDLALDAVPGAIEPEAVEEYLSRLPGVESVHDLHIWGMSTTETALTVHLVVTNPPTDDKFLHNLAQTLRDQFQIAHTTVQIEFGGDEFFCDQSPADVV